ncbi:MAG: GntR domain protein [Ilumatobacteraceae bacterium]|nr:GntR domain protein [Ilumatobacteraceae bacterium]MCU1389595.1 GntR domain protein [Ilumatobacteraceae bacterium]
MDEALPPESALMEDFNISRPTLREAFRILESEGLITVRRGSRGGARVQVPDTDVAARYAGFVLQSRGTTVADVLNARVMVESPAAGIVARRRDHVACARRLRAWLTEAAAQLDTPAYTERFHEFNRMLVAMTENETLILFTAMLEHISDAASTTYTRVPHADDTKLAHKANRTRHVLTDLIEAGDAVAAEDLWRRHLSDAGQVLVANRGTTVIDVLA